MNVGIFLEGSKSFFSFRAEFQDMNYEPRSVNLSTSIVPLVSFSQENHVEYEWKPSLSSMDDASQRMSHTSRIALLPLLSLSVAFFHSSLWSFALRC